MRAFEIHWNGHHILTAGVGEDGILSAILTWVADISNPNAGLHFHVGGIDGATDEHLDWPVPELGDGDEVTIKVVAVDSIGPEPLRSRYDHALMLAELQGRCQPEGE